MRDASWRTPPRCPAGPFPLIYPTNLSFLLDEFALRGAALPSLRHIRALGETVTPTLRTRVRETFGVGIADVYSSQELGTMAIQAGDADLYHVMEEGYIVEIVGVLDARDPPCAPGAIGRVVVTDLHNYAIPFARDDSAVSIRHCRSAEPAS